MNLRFLLVIVLFSTAIDRPTSAQQLYYNQRPEFLRANSVWVFGLQEGLDFNNGGLLQITTAMTTMEGCASVADPATGELLFYSNGGRVWNANHQLMPNGDSLLGNCMYSTYGIDDAQSYSTYQGVCIVPVVGAPGKYYLFSNRGQTPGGPILRGTLFYNVIDMNLEGGLGDIVAGQKNIVLDSSLGEAMIAVPGENCDIWLMVHDAFAHVFKAFHITHDGIDTIPVISTLNTGLPNYQFSGMAISPDRSKIALASQGSLSSNPRGLLIAEFDPITGQVTNEIVLQEPYKALPVCFSPDNSKLYVSGAVSRGSGFSPGLFQYDLTVYDSAAIANSLVNVDTTSGLGYNHYLKLNNDTLYYFHHGLNRINQPNLPGSACDVQHHIIANYNPSFGGAENLPNDVIFSLRKDTLYNLVLDSVVCGSEVTLHAPEGFETYLWENGDTSSNRVITSAGTYWLLSSDYCNTHIDTFIISGMDMISPVITVDEYTLGTGIAYSTYQWILNGQVIPGANDSTYTVLENGDYQVIVTDELGCTDTSEVYEVRNVGIVMPNVTDLIRIYPNPVIDRVHILSPISVSVGLYDLDGRLLKPAVNVNQLDLSGFARGVYFLKVYDLKGQLLKTEKVVR